MRLLARIGIERDVLDDAQLLLEGVLDLAPDYHAARFEYAQVLSQAPHVPAGAGAGREAARRGSGQPQLPHALRDDLRRASASTSAPIELYRDLLPGAAAAGGAAPVDRPLAEDPGTARGGDRRVPQRGRGARAASAMPTGAWRISRPTASRMRSLRRCAPPRRPPRPRSSTATTCASRSARRSRTGRSTQESFAYYARGNALKRSESRYRPEVLELNTRRR